MSYLDIKSKFLSFYLFLEKSRFALRQVTGALLQNNVRLRRIFLDITNQELMQENCKYTNHANFIRFWGIYVTYRRKIYVFEFPVFGKITTCSAGSHRRSVAK